MYAVCSIAAEYEIPYLKEWTEWNFKVLGFETIYLYLNNWSDLGKAWLRDTDFRGNMVFINLDGEVQQLNAYNLCLQSFGSEEDFIAFIDCDEFIVLKKHLNIKDFLSDYIDKPVIQINWKIFGSSGIEKRCTDYSVISRFKRCQTGTDQHTKSIVNTNFCRSNRLNVKMVNPHFANLNGTSPEGEIVVGPFNQHGSDDIAYIAHFLTKSKQECFERRSRNRADTGSPRENLEEFFRAHDHNEVENSDLLHKLNT